MISIHCSFGVLCGGDFGAFCIAIKGVSLGAISMLLAGLLAIMRVFGGIKAHLWEFLGLKAGEWFQFRVLMQECHNSRISMARN